MIQLTLVPKKILVVARTLQGITHWIAPLREAGCWVEVVTTPAEALGRAATLNPEVVVIEDQMPDVNPVELSMQIRLIVPGDDAPTFIVAQPSELIEESFSQTAEIRAADAAARRRALVKRVAGLMTPAPSPVHAPPIDRLDCQGLCLDRVRHRAWIGDRAVHLTPTEFKLLWEMVSRPGCVLSRTDLTKVCRVSDVPVQTRTIDAHVKSIRRKLKDAAGLIETVHGIGYRFQEMEP